MRNPILKFRDNFESKATVPLNKQEYNIKVGLHTISKKTLIDDHQLYATLITKTRETSDTSETLII